MQKILSQGAFHKWAVSFFVFLRDLSCPHFCCCCSNRSFSVWRSESFLEVSNPLHLPGIVLWKGDKLLHTRANVARMPSNCNLQSYSCFSHQLSLSTVRSKAVQPCLILSTCYEWKIYTFYSSYDCTSCVRSTDRVVEWKCMALVHSSFRVESCLVVLSVLSLSCTRGQNYCWLDKITCRVFKCISLAKTITWQQNSRGPFLLGLQFELFLCRLKVFSNGHRRKGKVQLLFVILGHSFAREWRVEN